MVVLSDFTLLEAQIAPLIRTVSGVVVDSLSGRAIASAEVYFGRDGDVTESGPDGRFKVQAGEADTVVVVRRIGYVPVRLRIAASVSATIIDVGRITLRPVATKLDRIQVEAEEVRLYPELADFYRRRHSLPGHFITPEDLDRARLISDALRSIPSVQLSCGMGGCVAVSHRVSGLFARKCAMAIYIDGLRQADMGIDEIPVEWVAGIEVYSGPSTTPAEFGVGWCGTVVIWTKRGGGP